MSCPNYTRRGLADGLMRVVAGRVRKLGQGVAVLSVFCFADRTPDPPDAAAGSARRGGNV